MRHAQIGRVLIADAHPLERLGVAALVKCALHHHDIDFASSHFELQQKLADNPAIVLVDLHLSGLAEHDLQAIRAEHPAAKLIILSSDASVRNILGILGCGVHGLIPKSLRQEEFVAALRQVAGGQIFVPASLSEGFAVSGGDRFPAGERPRRLSCRQRQVLRLASAGKSNKEIARELMISEATVKVHISAAFRSMGVKNRVSAVAMFRQMLDPQGELALAN